MTSPPPNSVSSLSHTKRASPNAASLNLHRSRLSRLDLLLLLLFLLLPPDQEENDADNDNCYDDTDHDTSDGTTLDCVAIKS